MYILTLKMYILAPKMDKSFPFEKGTAPVTAFVPFFLRVNGMCCNILDHVMFTAQYCFPGYVNVKGTV